jgi:hypothetical protein
MADAIVFIKIQTFKFILVAKDAFKQSSSWLLHHNKMNLTSINQESPPPNTTWGGRDSWFSREFFSTI